MSTGYYVYLTSPELFATLRFNVASPVASQRVSDIMECRITLEFRASYVLVHLNLIELSLNARDVKDKSTTS